LHLAGLKDLHGIEIAPDEHSNSSKDYLLFLAQRRAEKLNSNTDISAVPA
jgi:hypothetical protein